MDKHSNLLGPYLSYEKNEVLLIQLHEVILKRNLGVYVFTRLLDCLIFTTHLKRSNLLRVIQCRIFSTK